MHIKEKYDHVINTIEELISDSSLSSRDVGFEVSRRIGMQVRDLSCIFGFLLDMSLNSYILRRKMDLAYTLLINCKEKPDIQSAITMSGYADQPSFTKAFRRRYSMTPREAFAKKDMTLLEEPVFWDMLSKEITSLNTSYISEGEVGEKQTVFGISEQSFDLIAEALDLESFFGLPRVFSNYAFDLSKRIGKPLKECFQYAESIREDFDENVGSQNVSREDITEIGDDPFFQTVFFERGISVGFAWELRYDHHATLEDLMKCDMIMLKMFPGLKSTFEMSFAYYLRAYEFYANHFEYGIDEDDEYFNEYISLVMAGIPIEEAYEETYPYAAFGKEIESGCIPEYGDDDFEDDLDSIERDLSIEELAEEDERWSGQRIDDDLYYDPDNSWYDDSDSNDF